MLKKILIVILCAVFYLIWLSWPVYQFYAHKGEVGFMPWGEISKPSSSPHSQQVLQQRFKHVGNQALASLVSHQQNINAPGISAAVGIDGELVWGGTAGWADIEKALAVDANTQFRVGSTSKAITATGLARLLDQQLIDLDAPISEYHHHLPNSQWQEIKVKHLASHMSGLPHYKQFDDKVGLYRSIALDTHYADVNDALEMFDQTQLKFVPGSDFSYSTYGTVLLSAVMQEAAGLPYLELMQQQVFKPLGLGLTGAEAEFSSSGKLATFYWNNKGKNQHLRVWRQVDLSHRLAGGGLVSTSSELVKLGNAYFDNEFISSATQQKIWTPQRLSNGQVNRQNYAIGWRVDQMEYGNKTIEVMHHGGVSRGAQSLLVLIPEYKLSMAVNINANTDDFAHFSKVWKIIAFSFIQVIEQTNIQPKS
ncbi:serine hydrolase domain-containing protein [Paraglaciecola aestuariivivens]